MTSKRKNPEELPTVKVIGRILLVLSLPIFIVNFALMNMKDKDLRTIGLLLVIATCLLFIGTILSHLPQEGRRERENAK